RAREKSNALRNVARGVGPSRLGLGHYVDWRAIDRIVEPDVDVVFVVIGAGDEQRATAEEFIRPQELRVRAFLQARIVLLNLIAVRFVVQEERKVRVEVEERTGDETVEFKHR